MKIEHAAMAIGVSGLILGAFNIGEERGRGEYDFDESELGIVFSLAGTIGSLLVLLIRRRN
ncbi:MAG: hypothetical protein AAB439_00045 [Patescibacteria group bacterium]